MDGIFRRDTGREFHQGVIQEGDPAFDRCRHAHLILLHQQLNQVGFDIGIEKAMKQVAGRFRPVKHGSVIGISCAGLHLIHQQSIGFAG